MKFISMKLGNLLLIKIVFFFKKYIYIKCYNMVILSTNYFDILLYYFILYIIL